ncbi:Alginate lyase [Planctomycetes bacterium CA13]|uniref:Alginate lyase n=1 Tax=Novipirellula herctigrandis TaxID=2527986 RepID=A0A5C5ZBZ4_9BACT|nr:Alginate lyase [Planctomycetes bacterium CA13]
MNFNRNQIITFFVLVSCFQLNPTWGEFVHPGIAHSKPSIEYAKERIAAGQQPWLVSWEKLKDSEYSALNWKPEPFANVERGPYNDPNIGSSEFTSDGRAAYCHALCWALSGEEAHAVKAAEIIDAWSKTLRSVGNHDAKLLIGMSGYRYCIAAELLKHTWGKWSKEGQARFESMLRNIWYPIIEDFYPSANGNWDASMLQVMMAMGIFLDDQGMFDRAKNYFLNGQGNGAIGNYFMESGQCQESGRDQSHTQMGLEFLANTCETAWIQGVDLYGAQENRLLKGFEYTAKYNLGFDVPYVPYKSFEGRYHYMQISSDSRGKLRAMYERVYNHYHNRQGLDAPFTKQAALELRSDQPVRQHQRGRERGRRRRQSSSHLDTLMYAKLPAI